MADTDTAETTGSADSAGSGAGELADLGPMPEPQIEPGEPAPGGVDALPEPAVHLTPDLGVTRNPALEDKAPDAVVEEVDDGEDTSTEATRSSGPDAGTSDGSDQGGGDEQQLEPSE